MALSQTTTERTAALFTTKETKGTVLVVDDEPDTRKVVRLILEKAGYEVLEAEDGEQAILTIRSGENPLLVGVMITGIAMPNINGKESIAYFRKEYPSVQIVVLTGGYYRLEVALERLAQGVVDFLPKPIIVERILSAVAEAMERRRFNW